MRIRLNFFVVVLMGLTFIACEKDSTRIDDYLVEFATVEKETTAYRFRLDNGKLLIPTSAKDYSGKDKQRVVLNYTPLRNDTIKINYVSDIYTGIIEEGELPQNHAKDPVKIQSIWVGGGYLNIIMETEFHSIPHSLKLWRDGASANVDLYLSHDSNNDPRGYRKKMYASFNLSSLKESSGETNLPFRIFIETYEGPRIFELVLK